MSVPRASPERSRKNGDPTHIGPRGKSRSTRKGRYDGSFTPTEQRTKNRLMKQFTRLEGPSGNSAAYVNSSIWCDYPGCHRMNGSHVHLAMPELDKQLEELGRASFDNAVRRSNRR